MVGAGAGLRRRGWGRAGVGRWEEGGAGGEGVGGGKTF